jgi:hypothetical protein
MATAEQHTSKDGQRTRVVAISQPTTVEKYQVTIELPNEMLLLEGTDALAAATEHAVAGVNKMYRDALKAYKDITKEDLT